MGNCGSRPNDGDVHVNDGGASQSSPKSNHLTQKSSAHSSTQSVAVDNQIQIKIDSPAPGKFTTSNDGVETRSSTSGVEISAMLKNVPLLAKLSPTEREILGNSFVEKSFPDGYRMIVEGDIGREFFIIKEGKARVTKVDPEKKAEIELCQLTRHDYFGERALIEANSKRAATIAAIGPLICFVMNREKFVELFGKDKLNVTFAKRTAVSAETYDPKKEQKESSIVVSAADRAKSADQKAMILNVVRSSLLFQNLDAQQQEKVVDEMWLKTVNTGETIIKQGDLGDYWYVVEQGKFDIFVSRKGSEAVKVASRERGSAFGELALLYNAPRAATVTAGVESSVWVLDRSTFRRLLTAGADAKLAEYERFLRGVSSFESLLDYERSKIAETLEEVSFPDHHQICKQGEAGDSFFILKKGEVVVTKLEQGATQPLEVARYKPGDCFGEQALISKSNIRAATCTAHGPVSCLYLNRDAFNLLMGPMEDIFKRRVESYAAISATAIKDKSVDGRKVQVSSAADREENYLNKDIKLKDLQVIGTLGKGSFGHVQLVKDPKTGQTYALKTVGKAQVVALGQQVVCILPLSLYSLLFSHLFVPPLTSPFSLLFLFVFSTF
jgi:CRP-like cAMP-binding protein